MDDLFVQLQAAGPETAGAVEEQIMDAWAKSGSAAIDLLLRRGEDAMQAGEFAVAVEHLTAAIDHDPAFAEAYNTRAAAYFSLGLTGPAIDDIRQTLVLNPRHFGAMQGFGVILEQMGREPEALEIYERVLALYPLAPNVAEAVDRLQLTLEGQTL